MAGLSRKAKGAGHVAAALFSQQTLSLENQLERFQGRREGILGDSGAEPRDDAVPGRERGACLWGSQVFIFVAIAVAAAATTLVAARVLAFLVQQTGEDGSRRRGCRI